MKNLRSINNIILLIFSMVLTFGNFSYVKAETTDIYNLQVKISDATAKVGDEITVPISLSNVPSQGINNCNFNLQFDSNFLELVNVEVGTLVVNPAEDFSFNSYDLKDAAGTVIPMKQIQFFFCDESVDFSRAIKNDGVFANIKFRVRNSNNIPIPPTGLSTVIMNAPYCNPTSTTVDNRSYVFGINDINNGIINVYPPIFEGYVAISPSVQSIDFKNLQADEAAISFGDIIGDILLPTSGTYGSIITWSSSNPDVLSNTGKVTRPPVGQPDAQVTLTAKLVNGTATSTKTINVIVKAEEPQVIIDNLQVKISDATAKVGDEITVPISLSNVPSQGINNCNFNLQFDSNFLELVNVEAGTLVVNPAEDFSFNSYDLKDTAGTAIPMKQIQFFFCDESIDFSRAIKNDGVFANIKFRVKNSNNIPIPATGLTTVIMNAPYYNSASTTVDNRSYVFGINDINNGIINVYPPIFEGYVTISSNVQQTDLQNLQADEASISLGDATGNVIADIPLPVVGKYGSIITWTSSNPAVISNTGKVTRPPVGQPDTQVTLKAVFVNGTATETKTYSVIVQALQSQTMSDADAVVADKNAISLPGIEAATITENISLPTVGQNGTTISWTSNNPAIEILPGVVAGTAAGKVTRPAIGQPDAQVTLKATVTKGSVQDTRLFGTTVQALQSQQISDADAVAADMASLAIVYAAGDTKDSVTGKLTLPTSGDNGTLISWVSSNTAVVSNDGTVTRQAIDTSVTLTAKISKGTAQVATKEFTVIVKATTNADEEAVKVAKDALDLGDTTSVRTNLTLPTVGENGTTISWSSSNIAIVGNDGTVTRPLAAQEDASVTLTATITKGNARDTKIFNVIVNAVGNDMEVVIGNVAGQRGTMVEVNVQLKGVPATGIYTFNFGVSFDKAKLEYVGSQIVDSQNEGIIKNLSDLSIDQNNNGDITFVFLDNSSDESGTITENGTFATLKFKIKDDVTNGTNTNVSRNISIKGDFTNSQFNKFNPHFIDGKVSVKTIYGDLSGDNQVTALDLGIMKKYLLGKQTLKYPESSNLSSGDIDVTALDLGILKKYLLGKVKKFPIESTN